MKWEISLEGPRDGLATLAERLKASDPRVVKRGESFFLEFKQSEQIEEARVLRERASEIVACMSALSRVHFDTRQPMTVGTVSAVRTDGSRNYVLLADTARVELKGTVTMVVIRADGTREPVEQPPMDTNLAQILASSLKTPEMLRALRIRDADDLAWVELYRLFEIVREAVGGHKALLRSAWTTKDEVSRFTQTANSVAAAGDQARHGVEQTSPPSNPMTLTDARTFVDRLIVRWIGG